MGMIVYTCASCKGEFQYEETETWNQEIVDQEARENGWEPGGPGMATVCDDCFQELMAEHGG